MVNKSDEGLDRAVSILKAGGVIIFPTDTVWGIGASVERLDGIRRLYQIKGREEGKPTAVLVNGVTIASSLGEINAVAQKLIKLYWPGGLSVVVKAKLKAPALILGPEKSIALRQPDHKLTLDLLGKLGTGLVASSANFSGLPAPLTREMIDAELIKRVDLVLAGECGGQRPSTVVDTTVEPPQVIRQGEVRI